MKQANAIITSRRLAAGVFAAATLAAGGLTGQLAVSHAADTGPSSSENPSTASVAPSRAVTSGPASTVPSRRPGARTSLVPVPPRSAPRATPTPTAVTPTPTYDPPVEQEPVQPQYTAPEVVPDPTPVQPESPPDSGSGVDSGSGGDSGGGGWVAPPPVAETAAPPQTQTTGS